VPTAGRPTSLLFTLGAEKDTAVPQPVAPGSFADLGILEVRHIERWLAAQPRVLGEELLVVTTEFAGFDKTKERSDILALDVAGRLVVIELKRDTSGSRQDLQALRYAAFSSNLTLDDLVDLYIRHHSAPGMPIAREDATARFEAHVTEGSLDGIDEDNRPRIVLVAKQFQSEVTATVLWLREAFEMDISCVQLTPYEVNGSLLLTSSVLIPLPEATEYVMQREAKRAKAQTGKKVSWVKAYEVMARIPAGHWISYQELAVAAGGTERAGLAVGQYLANATDLPENCVHRVLRKNGEVSPGWSGDLGGPKEARQLLESEGLTFDARGRADSSRNWAP
jgi:alkylated DNA nucleotide flippase Atl1